MSSEKKTSAAGDRKSESNSDAKVSVRDTTSTERPVRRNFPGPRAAQSPLRVAVERGAHAELVAHAKESLNAEICGVLAGRVCADDEGPFVHVETTIRGTAASGGSTHVTFTHATWNAIHQTLERDHPKLRIVGWYHSHPGFGVEFSEMDVFIQKNFFSGPTQIAMVIDPLNGNVGVCFNTEKGIEYLPRYWVDGREHEAKMPAQPAAKAASASPGAMVAGEPAQNMRAIEERLGQLVVAVDDLRNSMYRFLLFIGALAAIAILIIAAYGVYYQMKARIEPPKNIGFAQVPVQIGDHTALLGVEIVKWDLPPEMDVMQLAVERAMEQIRRELEGAAAMMATNPAAAEAFRTNLFAPPAR